MADEFIQKQINELQTGHKVLEMRVKEATETAMDNNIKLSAMHKRLDEIDRDMLTEERMASVLEREFNAQVVRGVKAAILALGAYAVTQWQHILGLFK